jgi:hypothetical protein
MLPTNGGTTRNVARKMPLFSFETGWESADLQVQPVRTLRSTPSVGLQVRDAASSLSLTKFVAAPYLAAFACEFSS